MDDGSVGPIAAVLALATVHPWGGRVPRRLLVAASRLGFGMLTITLSRCGHPAAAR
ncbi:hypothetical protein [Amycolatopsis cihanbeyliensis]|uniref:hypothetical protein n=1 Tax=Amycolatopsis cihanbeyliensis TaxID=1128664 RepID=UPI0014774710|nr:hypothetical protein [Amycolatopsis cihanbeyliensis]